MIRSTRAIQEETLLEHAERELGMRLPDATWDYLLKKDFVQEAEVGLRTVSDLVEEARAVLAAAGRPVGRGPRVEMLSSADRERRVARDEALSLVLAAEANRDELVLMFRSQVLSNRLLDPAAVEAWIKRRALRDGPSTIWSEVPLKGKTLQPGRHVKTLAYPGPDGWVAHVPTAVGGTLDRLAGIARAVASQYGWQEAQATDYLLTGRTPRVSSLAAEYRFRWPFSGLTRIALSIDPRVSPREVATEYGRLRRQLLGTRHRDQSEKHLTVAAFCASRADGEKLSKQMTAWNAKYPKWKYTGVTSFGRDKVQALRRLLRPEYAAAVN